MMNNISEADITWMQHAINLAKQAQQQDEVPVGAVIVKDHSIIAQAHNQPIQSHDATAHAEIVALRQAGKTIENYRLFGNTTLYVTLEPCCMCAGAMIHARVSKLVFGAFDPRTGAAGSVFSLLNSEKLNHQVAVVGGVLENECAELLQRFFRERR